MRTDKLSTLDGAAPNTVRQHAHDNRQHYEDLHRRCEQVRAAMRSGSYEQAGTVLKRSYVFATLSSNTPVDATEAAFEAWVEGVPPKRAALDNGVVYPAQKAGWIERTFERTDWGALANAIAWRMREGDHAGALELVVDECVGVAYAKGAFTLALAGYTEFMCIDQHVAVFAGLKTTPTERIGWRNAEEYMDDCWTVQREANLPEWPAFVVQWAVFDFKREQFDDHAALYEHLLP